MKKFLLSAVSLAALATPALAADLPSRKAPVVAPVVVPMWTGFYAGLNAGYNFGTNDNTRAMGYGPADWSQSQVGNGVVWQMPQGVAIASALTGIGSMNQSGFIGGAQFGYNYQWGTNVVIGFETDIQGAGIRGTSSSRGIGAATNGGPGGGVGGAGSSTAANAFGSTVVNAGVDYLGTARGRIGYLWTPTLLTYGTAGLAYGGAWANVQQNATVQYLDNWPAAGVGPFPFGTAAQTLGFNSFNGTGQQSQLLVGWTAGGGAEWMFMPNWSIKAEALYWNLGNMSVNTTSYGLPFNTQFGAAPGGNWQNFAANSRTDVNYQGVIARMGVNYHFNFGTSPVVAKF